MAAKGADRMRTARSPKNATPYLFTGMVACGVCERKMSGHRTGKRLGYQCRLREQYAFPDDTHPKSLFVSERGLSVVTTEWLSELFAPDNRDRILKELAAAAVEPLPDLTRATAQLREAEQHITKLIEAVSAGIVEPAEAQPTLSHLRAQRDAAKATIAAADRSRHTLTATNIGDVLDTVGGLTGVLNKATRDEQMATYQAARLGIVYHPDRRAVTLKVSLGGGVSVRVGGPKATLGTRQMTRSTALLLP